MDETFFYVVAAALVMLVLAASFAGIRSNRFPSGRMLGGLLAIAALLVVSTAVGAVLLARAEQEHRREELSHEAAGEAHGASEEEYGNEEAASQAIEGQAAGGGGDIPGEDEMGEVLFVEAGCGDCHSLGAAGTAGAIGPNLDATLPGEDIGYIEQSIIDPDAEIASGFEDGIMPSTYSHELTEAQIDSLAVYIADSVAAFSE